MVSLSVQSWIDDGARAMKQSLESIEHIHFVGIGGAGMSALAVLCLSRGLRVTGSDMEESSYCDSARDAGATVFIGHATSQIHGAQALCASTAIAEDNPELVAAHCKGIPVLRRAQVLAELMAGKRGIGVAGTHGKTSSTALLGKMFEAEGLDPTVVVGGESLDFKGNVRLGHGDFFVVEADESDSSFRHLPCQAAVVTNIDDDHLEHHKTMEGLLASFLGFINGVAADGMVALCRDDERLGRLISRVSVPFVTYGARSEATYRMEDYQSQGFGCRFSVRGPLGPLGSFSLPNPGEHLALNATGCCALAAELGVKVPALDLAMSSFRGVKRRMQLLGTVDGVSVIDDYAHHPTEIEAVLRSLRTAWPTRRLIAVFQPHRSSRTALLFKRFATSFAHSDAVVLLPVYRPAGEQSTSAGTSSAIYEELRGHHPCVVQASCSASMAEAVPLVLSQLRDDDCVVLMGAGSVTGLGPVLVSALETSGAR